MDRINRMMRMIFRVDRSLVIAGLLSVGIFGYICLDYFRHGLLQAGTAGRFGAVMLLVFVLLAGIMRVMDADIAAEVRKLARDDASQGQAVFLFVTIKALVRMFLGVTIILIWLVGLLQIFGRNQTWGYLPVLLLGSGYSLCLLAVAFRVVSFVDDIEYPGCGSE